MKTVYIRLLSYDNALKVIDFAKTANIVVGGVRVETDDLEGIESIGVRYEISEEHPTETNKKIINKLKNGNYEIFN